MPYPDNPYPSPRMSDGEIRALFDAVRTEVRSGFEANRTEFAATRVELGQVKEQTTRTNGRVDRLESWRDKLLGAFLVLLFAQPFLTAFVLDLLKDR